MEKKLNNKEVDFEDTDCPNCGAVWGMEEIDMQRCHCCGYPDNEDLDDEDDY